MTAGTRPLVLFGEGTGPLRDTTDALVTAQDAGGEPESELLAEHLGEVEGVPLVPAEIELFFLELTVVVGTGKPLKARNTALEGDTFEYITGACP